MISGIFWFKFDENPSGSLSCGASQLKKGPRLRRKITRKRNLQEQYVPQMDLGYIIKKPGENEKQ